MTKKLYLSAPLPFVGQKRMFAREYIKVLNQFNNKTVFVDLFGGSGLLSHITKRVRPDATVVYNDFDNYQQRLANIPNTNALLRDLRSMVGGVPRGARLPDTVRQRVIDRLRDEQRCNGFVDFITISPSLLFSMRYETGLDGFAKEHLYNKIRRTDYPRCDDYLDGLTVTSCDYKELFLRYKDTPGVVFLVDPPYLSTDVGTYTMSWSLADYLDVVKVLNGHPFVYFTSNKSSIIELCEWLGANPSVGNPFENCGRMEFNAQMNYNSRYTDIMLFTKEHGSKAA